MMDEEEEEEEEEDDDDDDEDDETDIEDDDDDDDDGDDDEAAPLPPRLHGSVALVPQKAWCSHASVRENVCFARAYERARYRRVVRACALEADFAQMPAGDATEIGEKGVTLSGGQQARVALARSCYARADVYLLDDPLRYTIC